jgi:signal transduction histidine kinase
MGFAQSMSDSPVPLESVLCTEELNRRPTRQPNHEAVTGALVTLAQTMARSPERVLQQLVETALDLCIAHSSGVSLLEEEDGRKIFRWHAVAGQYASHLWGTTPREFSPCGTVLDTDKVQLMSHLDRHYRYFAEVEPRILEALLVPFHVDGEAVGTIWVISHNQSRQFDAEDARVLSTLGEFAAAAYQAFSATVALKSIVATIREPLLVLDRTLRVNTASRSYYETFQVTPSVTEGRLFYELGNGEWDIPELRTHLEDILPKESVLENFEVTQDFPLLGQRVMSLNARKLWREDNPTGLILLTIEDVTARRRVVEELLRSHEDSQRFASVAAHDLRAPLRSSMRLLEMLEHKADDRLESGDRQLLSLARANLQRLQALMSDILAYSQIGGGQAAEMVPLREPLEMALSNLQKEIDETGARVGSDILPSVKGDLSLITLVFQNLLSNAIKYRAAAPPHIRIEANKENGQWVVSVADNGQGFDPTYAEHIFLPFKRLHGPDMPGSGIGLATCRRIIERLGGRIWAESSQGKGAIFHFSLPDQ